MTGLTRFRESVLFRNPTALRAGLLFMASVLAAFILPGVLPFPRSAEALTLCYPVVGPVQRFNADLSGAALGRTRAHENVHAAQCRRDGAIWHFVRGAFPTKRLAAEAEAYCAEASYGVLHGGTARLEYARIQDELREIPWFRRVTSAALHKSLSLQCPLIAAAAAREEAAWQARIHGSL